MSGADSQGVAVVTLVAAEVWENKALERMAAVVCARFETGVYKVYVAGEFVPRGHVYQSADLKGGGDTGRLAGCVAEAIAELASGTGDNLTVARLADVGLSPIATEFAIEKAAHKYVRRIIHSELSSAQRFDPQQVEWEPPTGWERLYDGELTVQAWDANAKRTRAAEAIKKLEATIDADPEVSTFVESDTDYADRRRRKLALKRQKREFEELHGGKNDA